MRVIVIQTLNITPEEELNERLKNEFADYRIVSASTVIAPVGQVDRDGGMGGGIWFGVARHLYFCTTVVLEKIPASG